MGVRQLTDAQRKHHPCVTIYLGELDEIIRSRGRNLNIINTSAELLTAFEDNTFDLKRWEAYMDAYVPGAKELCLQDMRDCISAGYSWESAFQPVLDAVVCDAKKREEAVRSFVAVTEGLEKKIRDRFGKELDADVILYLGLCNGAGWVTEVNGRTTVLLGIEKIMELDFCDIDAMNGLIVHELGHVYQAQYGVFRITTETPGERFLWQLFTEGIAMVFEQEIIGDPEYFHQDKDGWKDWCDENAARIRDSFSSDLKSMTRENQRYFGDWVRFDGHGDTGYYLGARFVRFLLQTDDLNSLISYDISEVKAGFSDFIHS